MNAVHALFEHFIDYAGLFPPAELEMQTAAEEYAVLRAAPDAWMLGRFILPASRAGELIETLDPQAEPFAASLIVNAGTNPRDWVNTAAGMLADAAKLRAGSATVTIQMLEAPVPAPQAARDTFDPVIGQFGMLTHNSGMRDLPCYLELPRTAAWNTLLPGAMAALKRSGFGAKLRCGGVVQDAFPSCEEIAAFLLAAVENDVPFKATAGLHHPVRLRDPGTGLVMHGFLNVLAALLLARAGAPSSDLVAILNDEDASAFSLDESTFSYRTHTAGVSEIAAARAQFVSYGSCSFEEPLCDLRTMGFLEDAGAAA